MRLHGSATIAAICVGFLTFCTPIVCAAELPSDSEIKVLLSRIDATLGSGASVSLIDVTQDLIRAHELSATASPAGKSLLKAFPDSLRERGKQAHIKGDELKAVNYSVFADFAAVEINKPMEPPVATATPPPVATPSPPVATAPSPPVAAPSPPRPAAPAVATPPAPPPIRTDAKALIDRGDEMLRIGNVIAARMLYERAADLGAGLAALKLGDTYTQTFLDNHKLRGIKPDEDMASKWYQRAQKLGEPGAREQLQAMHRLADTE